MNGLGIVPIANTAILLVLITTIDVALPLVDDYS